jgi:type I restriction enzyme, R subunit
VEKPSANFSFLPKRFRALVELGTLAERLFTIDANTCLLKLRQFGEVLAQRMAVDAGLFVSPDESQYELLRRLKNGGVLGESMARIFHDLRKSGNEASHHMGGSQREALYQLKMAHRLAVWAMQVTIRKKDFSPGPFLPPSTPQEANDAVQAELERLRQTALEAEAKVEAANDEVANQRMRRRSAEHRASQATEEATTWQALAEDTETERQATLAQFAELQAESEKQPQAERDKVIDHAFQAGENVELDEADTRRLVDKQLQGAGWLADTEALRYSKGVRPQKNKNLAIAEWPTSSGPADYALFIGLKLVGVVEAKRKRKSVAGAIEQSKRYSRDYVVKGDESPPGGPWGNYKVPFLFATNGRPFLRQLLRDSGIWFLDARRSQNHARALEGWYTPQGLEAELAKDLDIAHKKLDEEPTDYLSLRKYQLDAVRSVEQALAEGQREMLVAMATGTGKTRTSIGLIYRLIKTKRLRRVLFLVDRTALGEQAANAFKDARLEGLQTFAQIFDIKELKDAEIDSDPRLHFATVQAMVKRVLNPNENAPVIPVDAYDGIVIDECHRGYLLDKEMDEVEMTYRKDADYVSTYRRLLDHFDAVKIGLTATPALHTTEIFGEPVYTYGYREAVVDGYLVDHEPPIRIITKLAEDGISWRAGEKVETYTPGSGQLDLIKMPDEVSVEVDAFNTRVQTENFNTVICQQLAKSIDPSLEEKTIIYCARDTHADMVVELLKKAFDEQYDGVDDDAVVKITGASDKPLQLIRRFKNERLPNVAVTVDLLSTGIDVPAVSNIVFIRRVRSRILYEQMMGRATRLCPDIGKEVFRIYDAVDLYSAIEKFTNMKPVSNPSFTFAHLWGELDNASSAPVRESIVEQILAKMQRKKAKVEKSPDSMQTFETLAGAQPANLLTQLTSQSIEGTAQWLLDHPGLAQFLDRKHGDRQKQYISRHSDEFIRTERGYGKAEKPKDYIESFAAFLKENINAIPALAVVTQRPRDLTRQQLKELKLALDQEGYTEKVLQTAWREMTNQDIAASIIGFIRQQALGESLVSYDERVDRALKRILEGKKWTTPQRKWLQRIGKQMMKETVVDREALDRGQFKSQGGFNRINKVFDGRLELVLGELHEGLWMEVG